VSRALQWPPESSSCGLATSRPRAEQEGVRIEGVRREIRWGTVWPARPRSLPLLGVGCFSRGKQKASRRVSESRTVSAYGDRALPLRGEGAPLSASTATSLPGFMTPRICGDNRRAQSRRRRPRVGHDAGRRERGPFPACAAPPPVSLTARVHRAYAPARRSLLQITHPTRTRDFESPTPAAASRNKRNPGLRHSHGPVKSGWWDRSRRRRGRAPCAASSSTRRRCTALYAASSYRAASDARTGWRR